MSPSVAHVASLALVVVTFAALSGCEPKKDEAKAEDLGSHTPRTLLELGKQGAEPGQPDRTKSGALVSISGTVSSVPSPGGDPCLYLHEKDGGEEWQVCLLSDGKSPSVTTEVGVKLSAKCKVESLLNEPRGGLRLAMLDDCEVVE